VRTAVKEAAQALGGGIDILVNNAGGASPKAPVHEQDVAAFRKLLDLNVVHTHTHAHTRTHTHAHTSHVLSKCGSCPQLKGRFVRSLKIP
jgi:NAD(P)-dependent dehydrogenase (short-subunit alcohol dehydrogenase family)